MTPELERHKANLAASNASSRSMNEFDRFEELGRLCAIVGSHMVSAGEAAWREDRELLAVHLRSGREGLILALKLIK